MSLKVATHFASAERAAAADISRQVDYFSERGLTRYLLEAVPTHLAILNGQRQIVYANRSLIDLVGEEEIFLHGRRPGEVLRCTHSDEGPGGCGTSKACSTCGAILAILSSLTGKREERECCLVRTTDGRTEVLNLMVFATPFEYQGERFTVFAVNDISHEKRRRTLERLFFHDVLNMAGGVRGFADLLRSGELVGREEVFQRIHDAAQRIIEEIEAQRTLAAAENGELRIESGSVSSRMLLEETVAFYRHHNAAGGRTIHIDDDSEEVFFESDRTLLGRVLGNMIKNALEGSQKGETVSVGCRRSPIGVEFLVHNGAVIPKESQHQIFRRSFSTKGKDRGLGTYSMKLLTEYLQGEISFTSQEEKGTLFVARYPLKLA
ncbi:sensor histidine kinase KdpD [Desulfuromonas sp. TF]|uniref:sensor histidine kinase n=1 Tax=Desulfuromonas sp. TF TaxID=1232410 RepID=UPI00040937C6|nr:HAMP domain-containing sensor histidine kinase [Desulfuromonas sp. TF]